MQSVVLVSRLSRSFRDPIFRIRVATFVLVVCLWQAVSVSGLLYEGVVPQPLSVAVSLVGELIDSSLYHDLGFTLLESFGGFLFGSLIAIAIGVWLGANGFMRRAFEPYIFALAGTPKVIFLPILFLVFGLGIESKIAKAALSAFFPVVFSAISGFLQISSVHIKVGESFGLNIWQKVTMIYLPAMLPSLIVGLRLGIAMSIIGVLSAEIAYSNVGLGFRLIRYADQFRISNMYATILIIFSTTALINHSISRIEKSKMRHHKQGVFDGTI
jgi:ABC-type nitrate/sulfonate/bicarbonate transport system permease component